MQDLVLAHGQHLVGTVIVARALHVATADTKVLQQVVDEPGVDSQLLAARFASGRPALQQAGQAMAFLDEGAEETLVAGHAQGVIECLEGLLRLLDAVQRHGQQQVQFQFTPVVLPVPSLFDRRAQAFDRSGAFTLGDAQALAGDAWGIHVVGEADETGAVPITGQLCRVQGLRRCVQTLFENRHAGAFQPGRTLHPARADLLADMFQLDQAAHPGGTVAVVVGHACGEHVGDDLVLRRADLLGEKQAARQAFFRFLEGGALVEQQAVENVQ
ncbi:hypothetical protein D9M71_128750 [compost metagenome]